MAPRETTKSTPKVQRPIVKTTRPNASPATIKKALSKNKTEKILKVKNTTLTTRPRTSTVPKMSTPKPKEQKSLPVAGSVTKSAKKSTWKKRPKPAHSGVPVPEKIKKLFGNPIQDSDSSF